MASNPLTRAQVLDKINNIIGTSLSTTWDDGKINDLVDQALSEISEAVPYVMVDTYQIETRRGSATATTADYLEDDTKSQFASTDVGKVVYNKTDKTWAVITSCSSASKVGISKDIMTSGEKYEIFNKGCWNRRQINIEDSGDFLWVIGAVYPVRPDWMFHSSTETMRNAKLLDQNKILELDVWWVDNTKDADVDKDVQIYFARQHKLNPNTDLEGVVNNGVGYTAGAVSMALDGLTDDDSYIYKDTLFYFTTIDAVTVDSRLTYRVTADAAISTSAATISFFPGLESGVSDDDTIAFVGSTLTPELERILIDMVTGQILMSEGITKINTFSQGGSDVPTSFYNMGKDRVNDARKSLKALVDVDLRANKVLAR